MPFLFLLVLISQLLYSQKWEKGYYYNREGKRYDGMFKLDRKSLPGELGFKNSEIKKTTLTVEDFDAFCTENDSFVVLRDLNIPKVSYKYLSPQLVSIVNYYKVIGDYPISGYIMYISSKYYFGSAEDYNPNYSTGNSISSNPYFSIFILKKEDGNYQFIYDKNSIYALYDMVKDDESVLQYLESRGFSQGIIKHAIEKYNERNGPSKK